MPTSSDQLSIQHLDGGSPQNRLFWRLFVFSVRRLGFSMLGGPGDERKKTEVKSNPVMQRARPLGNGYNPRPSWARLLNNALESTGPKQDD